MSGILPWQSHELVIFISHLKVIITQCKQNVANTFTLLKLMLMVTGQAVASW
jgi:hypothetical protein